LNPLQKKFEELSFLLIHHRDNLSQGTGVPFVRLIYSPEEERECRRLTKMLHESLEMAGLQTDEINCGEMVFKYHHDKKQLELRLKTAEENPTMAQQEIGSRAEQVLLQTILEKAKDAPGNRNIILSETGLLYPFARLGGTLQECENQVRIPLIVLYPAKYEEGKLLFMGKRDTGYYRTRDIQ